MSYNNHPNVRDAAAEDNEEGPVGEFAPSEQWIVDRITHTLTIYPRLSNSMLQVGVGTSLPPSVWKPILQRMIDTGSVQRKQITAQTPDGRSQVYTILSLTVTPTKK